MRCKIYGSPRCPLQTVASCQLPVAPKQFQSSFVIGPCALAFQDRLSLWHIHIHVGLPIKIYLAIPSLSFHYVLLLPLKPVICALRETGARINVAIKRTGLPLPHPPPVSTADSRYRVPLASANKPLFARRPPPARHAPTERVAHPQFCSNFKRHGQDVH